jgi:hypothetical protein
MIQRVAKRNRGVFRNASIQFPKVYRIILFSVLIIVLVACNTDSTEQTSMPVATITLIPPTATTPATSIPPTSTLESTIAPEITIAVVDVTSTPLQSEYVSLIDVDPIAAQLTFIAQRLVADQTGLPTRRVQVLSVSAITWLESSLGCPREGEMYTQTETDGYRIVLSVGDDHYIYHTDIDRVLPCPAGSEVLPENFIDPLAEITPEATEEVAPESTEET